MKPLIYIAGPYTIPDPVVNTRKAIEVAEMVLEAGGLPIVPHLSIAWQMVSPKTHKEWMDYDLGLIEHCHGMIRLPGKSKGADMETRRAISLGMLLYDGDHSPRIHRKVIFNFVEEVSKDIRFLL